MAITKGVPPTDLKPACADFVGAFMLTFSNSSLNDSHYHCVLFVLFCHYNSHPNQAFFSQNRQTQTNTHQLLRSIEKKAALKGELNFFRLCRPLACSLPQSFSLLVFRSDTSSSSLTSSSCISHRGHLLFSPFWSA